MAKEHKSIKATKKKAAMSPKEKKAAKKAKKAAKKEMKDLQVYNKTRSAHLSQLMLPL